jgi:hypothetical protein
VICNPLSLRWPHSLSVDGRIKINTVGRSIRTIAPFHKSVLFAGSHGSDHWAAIASLIEIRKPNAIKPLDHLTNVPTRSVNICPNSQIDDLLPWANIRVPRIQGWGQRTVL